MGIHNPLPSSMASECKKCGRILTSFVDPSQALSPEYVIPPTVLARAKGIAIITVMKAGIIGSTRFGSGVVIARLRDGTWSAPSAVALVGRGVGPQIGFQLTDFVFILNDAAAVRTFTQKGSLTLGGNFSATAGPVGRSVEAAGTASMKGVGGIFSYSKTKGLFAGVSVEGSAIVERRDANEKLYGKRYTAEQLLRGVVPSPPAAMQLMSVLNSRMFSGVWSPDDIMYNDDPVYDDRHIIGMEERGHIDEPKRGTISKDDIYSAGPSARGLDDVSEEAKEKERFPPVNSKVIALKTGQFQDRDVKKTVSWQSHSDDGSWA